MGLVVIVFIQAIVERSIEQGAFIMPGTAYNPICNSVQHGNYYKN
jgi:hypothetical protein